MLMSASLRKDSILCTCMEKKKKKAFERKVSLVISEFSASLILAYLSHRPIYMAGPALRQRRHQTVLACVTVRREGGAPGYPNRHHRNLHQLV